MKCFSKSGYDGMCLVIIKLKVKAYKFIQPRFKIDNYSH